MTPRDTTRLNRIKRQLNHDRVTANGDVRWLVEQLELYRDALHASSEYHCSMDITAPEDGTPELTAAYWLNEVRRDD